jgi:hypothetical protein
MNTTIPERRNSFTDYNDNCYKRALSNGTTEYYSKEFYNSNFTRKSDDLDDIKKEILLFLIDDALKY